MGDKLDYQRMGETQAFKPTHKQGEGNIIFTRLKEESSGASFGEKGDKKDTLTKAMG